MRGNGSPAWVLVAAALVVPGCLGTVPQSGTPPGQPVPFEPSHSITDESLFSRELRFDGPILVDGARAGGEPVVRVTPKGTILIAAHPGPTHHRTFGSDGGTGIDSKWVQSVSGQNMLWRSVDGGKTWAYVGFPGLGFGPRDAAHSISDPDLAIDAAGRIFMVGLHVSSISVSRSEDDGLTWVANPVADPTPFPLNDRPWIEAWRSGEVWITTGGIMWKSVDGTGGLAYRPIPPNGINAALGAADNLHVDPRDGTLYRGQGPRVSVSLNGGNSWAPPKSGPRPVPEDGRILLDEPAVDAAGYVYAAYFRGNSLRYAAWTPKLDSFLGEVEVANLSGTHLWPWVVAGDEGRIAIAWLGSHHELAEDAGDAEWWVYAAVIENANTRGPVFHVARTSEAPIHAGALCQGGVSCVLGGDRRLGDFLTATVDLQGSLLVAVGGTLPGDPTHKGDRVGHPVFIKQAEGPSLRVPNG